MKTTLRMAGCISIALLLIMGTALSASGKLSGGAKKEENKKLSGWIGVMVQDLNEKIVRKEKLDIDEGAYILEVVEDSPADSAGIQQHDVVIEFNGKNVFDSDDFVKLVRRTPPNTKVNLVLIRDGEKKTLNLTVGKRKEQQRRMFSGMHRIPNIHAFSNDHILGLQLFTLNEQLGEYFGVPNNEGVLVEEVEQKSAAEKAGFKAGDIIIRVGKKTVDAVEKIQRELQKYEEGDIVEFEVIRKGSNKILKVELEEQQCIRKNFFFPKPHIQMFRTDPSDDAEMQLDINDLQIDLDRLQKEIEKSARNFKGWNNAFESSRSD